jgi:hypothetical protein
MRCYYLTWQILLDIILLENQKMPPPKKNYFLYNKPTQKEVYVYILSKSQIKTMKILRSTLSETKMMMVGYMLDQLYKRDRNDGMNTRSISLIKYRI